MSSFEIFGTRFWGVRKANADREIFEQSKSYIDGKKQELVKLHHEWIQSKDNDSKLAIESTIRISFASFDENNLSETPELYNWLKQIKYK